MNFYTCCNPAVTGAQVSPQLWKVFIKYKVNFFVGLFYINKIPPCPSLKKRGIKKNFHFYLSLF